MCRPNPATSILEASQEFHQPRLLAFGQAAKPIRFLGCSVLVFYDCFFQGTRAAIVKQGFVIGQLRSQPPEGGSANFSSRFRRHTFAQDCGAGADVMEKEVAVRMKFLVS